MIHRLKLSIFVCAFTAMCLCIHGCSRQDKLSSAAGTGEKAGGLKCVELITNRGRIVLELDEQRAPVTVANFLRYVEEGFYEGTIFHRVIPKFMIQTGGYTTAMKKKPTHEPIINEANNGLSNTRGTVAMARKNAPDSATSQFYINVADNAQLDYAGDDRPGYAVFGKVVEGMDVVDKIENTKRGRDGRWMNMPTEPILIKSAGVLKGK